MERLWAGLVGSKTCPTLEWFVSEPESPAYAVEPGPTKPPKLIVAARARSPTPAEITAKLRMPMMRAKRDCIEPSLVHTTPSWIQRTGIRGETPLNAA